MGRVSNIRCVVARTKGRSFEARVPQTRHLAGTTPQRLVLGPNTWCARTVLVYVPTTTAPVTSYDKSRAMVPKGVIYGPPGPTLAHRPVWRPPTTFAIGQQFWLGYRRNARWARVVSNHRPLACETEPEEYEEAQETALTSHAQGRALMRRSLWIPGLPGGFGPPGGPSGPKSSGARLRCGFRIDVRLARGRWPSAVVCECAAQAPWRGRVSSTRAKAQVDFKQGPRTVLRGHPQGGSQPGIGGDDRGVSTGPQDGGLPISRWLFARRQLFLAPRGTQGGSADPPSAHALPSGAQWCERAVVASRLACAM